MFKQHDCNNQAHLFHAFHNLLLLGDFNLKDWDFVEAKPHDKPKPLVGVGSGVDGCFGGVEEGVLNKGAAVILSRNVSICFRDKALCRVSRGLIGGTPPKPSIAETYLTELLNCLKFKHYYLIFL